MIVVSGLIAFVTAFIIVFSNDKVVIKTSVWLFWISAIIFSLVVWYNGFQAFDELFVKNERISNV